MLFLQSKHFKLAFNLLILNKKLNGRNKMSLRIYLIITLFLLTLSSPQFAAADPEPTTIVVHVLAHDAKLIGTSVGGALVTIRDRLNGKILAQGKQLGETGSTEIIMKKPHQRGENRFAGEDSPAFVATVLLENPTIVEVAAEGPLGFPQAMQKSTKTLLLVPGKDLTGEGIVLTLHGFIVDIMSPESVDSFTAGEEIPVKASVRMMCGCPTEPGGLWDSSQYEIKAQLIENNMITQTASLEYSGRSSVYEGTLQAPMLGESEKGSAEIHIVASDPAKANFGFALTTITIKK